MRMLAAGMRMGMETVELVTVMVEVMGLVMMMEMKTVMIMAMGMKTVIVVKAMRIRMG